LLRKKNLLKLSQLIVISALLLHGYKDLNDEKNSGDRWWSLWLPTLQ
jgi:hypothetical protein